MAARQHKTKPRPKTHSVAQPPAGDESGAVASYDAIPLEVCEKRFYLASAEEAEAEAALRRFELKAARQDATETAAALESRRVLTLYGAVDKYMYNKVVDTLGRWVNESNSKPVTIVINSPGGYVIEGLAIYDFIRGVSQRGVSVTTVGLGYVASMGGILLQAGDTRLLAQHSWLLIHEVSGGAVGKMSELEDEMKFTKRLQTQCLDILASRATLSRATIKKRWMKTDWWLDPEEAVVSGFADAVTDSIL